MPGRKQKSETWVAILLTVFILFSGLIPMNSFVGWSYGEESRNHGTTWYVDDDAEGGGNGSQERPYNEIQEAVNASLPGDTVRVFNGTYHENVMINTTLDLIGNGSLDTTVNATGSWNAIEVNAVNVTVSGFHCTGADGSGIYIAADLVTVRENNCSGNGYGIILYYAENNTILRNSCLFNSLGISCSNSHNNTISRNTVQWNTANGIGLTSCKYTSVSENSCENNTYSGVYNFRAYKSSIRNNTCRNNRNGISSAYEGGHEIANNYITNNNRYGISLSYGTSDITARNNNIYGNDVYGLKGNGLDALYNWWGHASGPYHSSENPDGKGDEIDGNSDFKPWLEEPVVKSDDNDDRTLYVDDDAPEGGNGSRDHPFQTIQEAVNASISGDTVRVFNGTYHENVVLETTVSLIGNGSENTTIDGGGQGDVVRISTDGCNLSGFLIVNGGNSGDKSGIKVVSDSNTISDNTCSNNTNGIWINSADHNTITRNNCSANTRKGICFWNSDLTNLSRNTCNDNEYGIYMYNSQKNMITGSSCISNSQSGIFIDSYISGPQPHPSRYNTIADNSCNANSQRGIHLYKSSSNTILNNSCDANRYMGIFIEYSDGCTVNGNTCSKSNWGIHSQYSDDLLVSNNICTNNAIGLYFSNTNGFIITNNTCIANTQWGMELRGGHHHTVSRNILTSNHYGIYLDASNQNDISNNAISSNAVAIFFLRVSGCTLENNTMVGNGLDLNGNLHQWNSHEIDTTNTVNGKPIRYLKDVGNTTVPEGAGQVILANCSRVTVEEQDCSNASAGLLIGHSKNITVTNNTCNDNVNSGIKVSTSENMTIRGNSCNRGERRGLYIYYTDRSMISNNSFNDNGYGITLHDSNWNTVFNNSCTRNSNSGMLVSESQYNTLNDNTLIHNNNGLYLGNSEYNTIDRSNCSDNTNGLYISYSDHNIFTNNTLESNSLYGVYLYNSKFDSLTNTTMKGSGIHIFGSQEAWDTHDIDTTNSVNGKPVRYYTNTQNQTVLSGAGQVIVAGCSQMVIEGQNCSDTTTGIAVGHSSSITIVNSTCNGNIKYGIYLYGTKDSIISNSTCNSNGYSGFHILYREYVTLDGNTCTMNGNSGLFIQSVEHASISNCTILDNPMDLNITNSNLPLTNSTVENVNFQDDKSSVSMHWFVDIEVLDPYSAQVSYAMIRISDSHGNTVFHGYTDGNGRINTTQLMGSYLNRSGEFRNNPFSVNITKKGYLDLLENITVHSSTGFVFLLDDKIPPNAQIAGNESRLVLMDSPVFFDGSDSSGQNITYSWDFGNGNTTLPTLLPHTNHTYSRPGEYPILLTVTDRNGNTSTDSMTIIVENVLPTVTGTADRYTANEDEIINFLITGIHDTPSDSLSFHWDFGDGNTSTSPTPAHAFSRMGNYSVVLTAIDRFGGNTSTTMHVTIHNVAPWNLTITTDSVIYTRLPIHFLGYVMDSPSDMASLDYVWDWGDDTRTYNLSVTDHRYDLPGNYTVTLRVSDDDNISMSAHLNISVLEPMISFSIDPMVDSPDPYYFSMEMDHELTFTADFDYEYKRPFSYTWYIGEDIIINGTEITHTFTRPQEVSITLKLNQLSLLHFFQVDVLNIAPAATIRVPDDQELIAGQEFTLDASKSTDTPTDLPSLNYTWQITDPQSNTITIHGVIINHTFHRRGQYEVTLQVRDQHGDVSEDSIKILVHQKEQDEDEDSFPWYLVILFFLIAVAMIFLLVQHREPTSASPPKLIEGVVLDDPTDSTPPEPHDQMQKDSTIHDSFKPPDQPEQTVGSEEDLLLHEEEIIVVEDDSEAGLEIGGEIGEEIEIADENAREDVDPTELEILEPEPTETTGLFRPGNEAEEGRMVLGQKEEEERTDPLIHEDDKGATD